MTTQIPVLKQGEVLVAALQADLADRDLVELRDELANRVGRQRISDVIVDVSLVDMMDSFATRTLRNIADMVRLRGADTIIVGIQPDVAFAMVQLGLTLADVPTALDLEEGLELLAARKKDRGVGN